MTVRASGIIGLVRFLLIFVVRRVLRRGPLSSRPARILAASSVTAAFAAYCGLSVAVLRHMFPGTEFIRPLILTASIATAFWVAVAYMLVRVLFLKADALLELSFTLPVTNKERVLGIALFEAFIVGLILIVAFGGLATASLVLLGPPAAAALAAGVVMPGVTLYLVASAAYLLVERALLALRASRVRGLVVPAFLALLLVGTYLAASAQSQAFLRAYVAGTVYWAPQMRYLWLLDAFGPALTAIAFLTIASLLVGVVLLVAPRSYVPMKKHVKVLPSGIAASRFGVHLLAVVRSFESGVAVLLAIAIMVGLSLARVEAPPYVLLLTSFQGFYAFSNSESLRRTGITRVSPASEYLCMVGAQATLLVAISVPAVALALSAGIDAAACLAVVGLGLSNIAITTLAGVAFPPERGNPFSVLVGVTVVAVTVGTVVLGVNIFSLPTPVTVGGMAALTAVAAAYSVYGIARIEKNRRHAHDLVA